MTTLEQRLYNINLMKSEIMQEIGAIVDLKGRRSCIRKCKNNIALGRILKNDNTVKIETMLSILQSITSERERKIYRADQRNADVELFEEVIR